MKFAIFTHVIHKKHNHLLYAYAPYVHEMNLWIKYVDEVEIIAPFSSKEVTFIESGYNLERNKQMLNQVQYDGKQHHSAPDAESFDKGQEKKRLQQAHNNIEGTFDKIKSINLIKIPAFDITSLKNGIKAIFKIPAICYRIFKSMKWADHIHLRCPGNIGLLAGVVQILFPNKPKTIKYAGNWDANSKQPFSYKFQKWILSNTFLTRNAKVLVYGEWTNQSKNIISFFTATYSEEEICHSQLDWESHEKKHNNEMLNNQVQHGAKKGQIASSHTPRNDKANCHSVFNTESFKMDTTGDKKLNQVQQEVFKFIFVGALTKGKQPLLSVKIVNRLKLDGYNVTLDIFGEGEEKTNIEKYINKNNLLNIIKLHGNKSKHQVKEAYKKSNFLLFVSKSEGWPKVVAEAMFWGCIPITSRVSCVPWMLAEGKRGLLVDNDIDEIISTIERLLTDKEGYRQMSLNAQKWSQQYTLEYFEKEISKILIN